MSEQQVEGKDTRSRIQAVALELFTEQGYDKTSLREIAEKLGVTKAALYYHFKSKEEIVESVTADQAARIDQLVAWAAEQPRTALSRKEFLRRYADSMMEAQHYKIMRFYERNQATMKDRRPAKDFRGRMQTMIDFLVDEDATPAQRLRASMALFTLHACWFVLDPDKISDDERIKTALEMSYELIDG